MMCQEAAWIQLSKNLVEHWYMKHAFKDLRPGSWLCAKTKTNKSKKFKNKAESAARSLNLQRAARGTPSRKRTSFSDPCGWMFQTVTQLYSITQKKYSPKDTFTKLKSLIHATFESREADGSASGLDPVSSTSLTELIVPSLDFDLDTVVISTDSEVRVSTGIPPSRRSSASFFSTYTTHTSERIEPKESLGGFAHDQIRNRFTFRSRSANHYNRRKRSIFRESDNILTASDAGSSNAGRPHKGAETVTGKLPKIETEKETMYTTASDHHPDTRSRGTGMTMDTTSSPSVNFKASSTQCCKSTESTSWLDSYDIRPESSLSSWNEETSSIRETKCSASDEFSEESCKECRRAAALTLGGKREKRFQKKPSSLKISNQWRATVSASSEDDASLRLRKQLASGAMIKELRSSGKNFQEAIVDIILENDVHDLVDLEEFLQGYFRLNALYQDIIKQFFSDLSNDLVHPQVSRAPSVFARLASSSKSVGATNSKANAKKQ